MSRRARTVEPFVVGLSILETYAVRWSRETTARDVVQNFFDEVADFSSVAIEIDDAGRRVRVSGPSELHVDYLRYLGATTKADPGRRSAGGFGEGFKICALVLLRDFHAEVMAGSGDWELRAFLRPVRLGNELAYEIRGRERVAGSFVELRRADKALRQAFARVRDDFKHPANPRLARPLHVDEAAGVGIWHAADDRRGDVFYRRQRRGVLRFPRGAALTFALDDRLPALDGDRDRRDLRVTTPVVAEVCRRVPLEVLETVVRHLRHYWQSGGGALRAVLKVAKERGLRMTFPRRWVARLRGESSLEALAEKTGAHLGVAALAHIGMPNLLERYAAPMLPRRPTPLEAARIHVARQLYGELSGRPTTFRRHRVVDLAESARHRLSRDDICILPASLLAAPFDDAIADCLDALARSTGMKGRVSDADRLTDLIRGAIARPEVVEAARQAWDRGELDGGLAEGDDDDPLFELASYGLTRRSKPLIFVEVLAPPGFPPSGTLAERLKPLARRVGVDAHVLERPVRSLPEAILRGARGIPTIEVNDLEVAPRRGSRASFELRTYGEPPSLLPDDETLCAALVAARDRDRRSPWGRHRGYQARRRAAERKLLRHLARTDRAAYVKHRRRFALDAVDSPNWPDAWPFELRNMVRHLARQRLAALPFDDERVDEQAREVSGEVSVAVTELVRGLRRAVPALRDAACHDVLDVVVRALWASLQAGAPFEALEAEGQAMAPPLCEVARATVEVPLDSSCATACRTAALRSAKAALGRGPEAAVESGLEAFARAIAFCRARHEERDEQGEPPLCHSVLVPLLSSLGLADPPAPTQPDPCEEAVRAAWDQALAEGADELEAARRALAACEACAAERSVDE